MDLPSMRTRVRRDLHDEDAANYRWSNDTLDRHIDRAVRELGLSIPLQTKATLTATPGSRELSVAGLAGLVHIEAVEYPTGKYPPLFVQFSLWATTLTPLADGAPASAESVNVYYGKTHTLDGSSSTIPPHLEDLVATGAAGYAAIEWASFATNRVNLGGESVWRSYLTWGQERLAVFNEALASHGRKNAVRLRRLYKPAEPAASQTTDWGP